MKILIDGDTPYAHDPFNRLGEVTTVPGRPTPVAQLVGTDALMVRLVTKANESLLAGKPIKFVGTATAETDHADEAWLKQAGTGSSAVLGCNAIAIVEHVLFSLLMSVERDGSLLHGRTVGIVGASNVGRHLQARLGTLGTETLLCDPSHADCGDRGDFHSLDELVQHTDILTFHMLLFKNGPYETLHLVDEKLIRSLKLRAILTNTCRSVAVNSIALLTCLSEGQKLSVVLDVWEGRPELNVELLKKVDISTPHIAGYTLEGKTCGTTQVSEVYSKFIGYEQHVVLDALLPVPEFGRITLHGPPDQPMLKRLVHLVYGVRRDDVPLRKAAGTSGEFDKLYKNYFECREWSFLYVIRDDTSAVSLLCELGFNAVHHSAR